VIPLPAATATNRKGKAFVHEFSAVMGRFGRAWFQCSCTEQCPTRTEAEAHIESVRAWQRNHDIDRRVA
jgi:hypothetical protein